MLTVENEYFLRLLLLIFKGGTSVLRQVFRKKLEDSGFPLNGFLHRNKEQIDRLKHDKWLTVKQYSILFPSNGKVSDLGNYDISLLSCLLLNILPQTLKKSEVKAIENIRTLRNELPAHHPNDSIDVKTFFKKWNQLHQSINNLGSGLTDEQRSNLEEVIRCVGEDPINIKQVIQVIKDATSTSDQFMEHVSNQLENLSILVQQLNKSREDILTDVINLIKRGENRSISSIIVGEVTVSSENPEAVVSAANILIEEAKTSTASIRRTTSMMNDDRKGVIKSMSFLFGKFISYIWSSADDTTNAKTEVKERQSQASVTALVQAIHNAGGDIKDVKEGSVLLYIQCNSVFVLSEILNYFQSSDIERRLNGIANCLTEEVGSCIHLSASIQEESLREVLLNLQKGKKQEYFKKVRLSINTQNADGVLNVVKLMDGGFVDCKLSVIAKELSNEVGYSVTLKSSIDKDPLQQFIVEKGTANEDIDETKIRGMMLDIELREKRKILREETQRQIECDRTVREELILMVQEQRREQERQQLIRQMEPDIQLNHERHLLEQERELERQLDKNKRLIEKGSVVGNSANESELGHVGSFGALVGGAIRGLESLFKKND